MTEEQRERKRAYNREYRKKYYAEHKEENREYLKKYYAKHKEEIREYRNKYYAEHKEEIKAKNKTPEQRQKNKEYMRRYRERTTLKALAHIRFNAYRPGQYVIDVAEDGQYHISGVGL